MAESPTQKEDSGQQSRRPEGRAMSAAVLLLNVPGILASFGGTYSLRPFFPIRVCDASVYLPTGTEVPAMAKMKKLLPLLGIVLVAADRLRSVPDGHLALRWGRHRHDRTTANVAKSSTTSGAPAKTSASSEGLGGRRGRSVHGRHARLDTKMRGRRRHPGLLCSRRPRRPPLRRRSAPGPAVAAQTES